MGHAFGDHKCYPSMYFVIHCNCARGIRFGSTIMPFDLMWLFLQVEKAVEHELELGKEMREKFIKRVKRTLRKNKVMWSNYIEVRYLMPRCPYYV